MSTLRGLTALDMAESVWRVCRSKKGGGDEGGEEEEEEE